MIGPLDTQRATARLELGFVLQESVYFGGKDLALKLDMDWYVFIDADT